MSAVLDRLLREYGAVTLIFEKQHGVEVAPYLATMWREGKSYTSRGRNWLDAVEGLSYVVQARKADALPI